MKEAIIAEGPIVTIQDVPIPKISDPRQLIIKVIVSGSNPKDWKGPIWYKSKINQGDDIAGIVHEIGGEVTEFKVGDRVAALHQLRAEGGSYAEYALAWDWSTFHIPKNTSFEEAATIPLAAMTAVFGLYQTLALPHPWTKATEPLPLVIYGAATTVGAFAIKLANLSNIHPLICVAGRGADFVETLIDRSKGDIIVDYRQGDKATIEGIKKTLNGQVLKHAFDAVTNETSYINICHVLDHQEGRLCLVLGDKSFDEIPKTIRWSVARVAHTHEDIGLESGARYLACSFFRLFGSGLAQGWFKPHPHEVVPGGLEGVQTALCNMRDGNNSALKYVFRIAETLGLDHKS